MICLKCNGRTEVLETAQKTAQITRRRRRCTLCGDRFSTIETPVGHEKRETKLGEVMTAVAHRTRRIEPEVLTAMLATDRRKARIAREQRARERYDDEHAAPSSLRGEALRRELKGY